MSLRCSLDIRRRGVFLDRRALSPAIAAALLLAITIAVVAAVGYIATNITTTPTRAPQGVFVVQITKDFGLMIRQISGDAIPTNSLKLVFEVKGVRSEVTPDKNNTLYGYGFARNGKAGEIIVAVSLNNATNLANKKVQAFDGTSWVDATLVTGSTWQCQVGMNKYNFINYTLPSDKTYTEFRVIDERTGLTGYIAVLDWGRLGPDLGVGEAMLCVVYEYASPWLQTGELPAFTPSIQFGQYTISPGGVMKALDVWATTDDIRGVIKNWDDVKVGDIVKVIIVYTPTNQVIWQGEVVVG